MKLQLQQDFAVPTPTLSFLLNEPTSMVARYQQNSGQVTRTLDLFSPVQQPLSKCSHPRVVRASYLQDLNGYDLPDDRSHK